MLSKEQLLIPRYKVIAYYPNSKFPIGTILTLDKYSSGKWWHEYTDDEPIHLEDGDNRFPAIFKPLEWWERRSIEDLPEYLMRNTADKKVVKAELHNCDATHGLGFLDTDGRTKSYCNYTPATLEDYQLFITTKK